MLSLYESFPLRDKLFYWQEKMLFDFSEQYKLPPISILEVYLIFNHCPVHDVKLIKECVPIKDGNKFSNLASKKDASMANFVALRNLEMKSYPEKLEVYCCLECRKGCDI